jgi:putative acetyltransferase
VTPVVRPTTVEERGEVLSVVRSAFTSGDRDGQEEVAIVVDTWDLDASPPGYDLVAVDDDRIVGHVLAGIGDLDGRPVPAIAPLAVRPDRQHQGLGTRLMGALLGRADDDGWPLILLLGNPGYYARFGFDAAGPLGIVYPAVGADDPHFLARTLTAYDPGMSGSFTYCWEQSR